MDMLTEKIVTKTIDGVKKWVVVSHEGKNLGAYPHTTEGKHQAHIRLGQVEAFKARDAKKKLKKESYVDFLAIESTYEDEKGDAKYHSKKDDNMGKKNSCCNSNKGYIKTKDGLKCISCGKVIPNKNESFYIGFKELLEKKYKDHWSVRCEHCGHPLNGSPKKTEEGHSQKCNSCGKTTNYELKESTELDEDSNTRMVDCADCDHTYNKKLHKYKCPKCGSKKFDGGKLSKDIKESLDEGKVTIEKSQGEYRVPSEDGYEDGAHYTDDKDDAIAVAKKVFGADVEIKFRSVSEFVGGKYEKMRPTKESLDEAHDFDRFTYKVTIKKISGVEKYVVVDKEGKVHASYPYTRKGKDDAYEMRGSLDVKNRTKKESIKLDEAKEVCKTCGNKLGTKTKAGHGEITTCTNLECKDYNKITKQINKIKESNIKRFIKVLSESYHSPTNLTEEESNTPRSISAIARDIRKDWKNVNFAAKPYLSSMSGLEKITDKDGYDSAYSIINYFLSNASQWKGEKAKEIKAELKALVKGKGK